MNDETFLEDNERFKFNDITIGKQDRKRTGETSPSGAECIGLIGVAITHPRVKPAPRHATPVYNLRVSSRPVEEPPGVVYRRIAIRSVHSEACRDRGRTYAPDVQFGLIPTRGSNRLAGELIAADKLVI